jgi:hypothetical protein
MNSKTPSYPGYRFPPEIISHAVWLYHRFCLSFRDVEGLPAQRTGPSWLLSYTTANATPTIGLKFHTSQVDIGIDAQPTFRLSHLFGVNLFSGRIPQRRAGGGRDG